jgi:hypothetical protein
MIRRGLLAVALLVAGCGAIPLPSAPPDLGPPVECLGIPGPTCQQIIDDARANAEPGTVPVRIRAVCTAVCTLQQGDVSVEVRYSNGRVDTYGMGWSGPGVAPPPVVPGALPVDPTCQGVPEVPCRDRALESVVADPARPAIRDILVRCTVAVCTEAAGTGETVITYADDTTTTSGWGYQSPD